MTFGCKLKNIRISMGLSQEEFAKKLNTTKQVISRYEKEQRTPKITVAQTYADILNVSLNDLIDNNVDLTIEKNAPVSEDVLNSKEFEFLNKLNLLNPDFMRIAVAISPLDSKSLAEVADIVEAIAKLKANQ